MQFFVQDVREWGNKKIFANFVQSADGGSAFIERLRIQNMMLVDCKSTAFSLPKTYNLVYEKIKGRYYGMECFMNNCEPLILSVDTVEKSVQRRFRNQWDSCWSSFGKSACLRPETANMVKELGIRICFSPTFDRLSDELFEFYNAVLKWFVYTSTEGAIMETGLTPTQLVERMILNSSASFVHDIQVGF